jgi:hypothetical protein
MLKGGIDYVGAHVHLRRVYSQLSAPTQMPSPSRVSSVMTFNAQNQM